MISRKLAVLAAVSLVFASSTAAAQSVPQTGPSKSAARLSLNPAARAGTPTRHDSQFDRRGYGIYIIGAIVLGLGVWGIIEATRKKDNPSSP
jgi:hypothetical protein